MRTRIIAAVVVGLSMCGLGAAAAPRALSGDAAGHPLRMFLQGQVGRLMTLRSELDVTPEQRAAIQKIVVEHKSEIATVAKPIVANRRALRDATLAKDTNEAAIRTAANDLGKSIGDAAVLASKLKGEASKVLSPDQMKKIEVFRADSDTAVDGFLAKFAQ